MKRRICVLAGSFDVTLAVCNGLAAWSRMHDGWRIEAMSVAEDGSLNWLARAGYGGFAAVGASLIRRKQLAAMPQPVVCISTEAGELPVVNVDDAAIGRLGAEHLYECGYRRLAFYGVGGAWSRARYDAFAAFAKAKQVACVANGSSTDGWPDWNGAQDELRAGRFLGGLGKPVAIMACSDMLARVLADACADLKLNVPGDVAILGVDNSQSMCESEQMTLSSVDTDLERLGQEAGRLLQHAFHRRHLPLTPVLVPPRAVVPRRSTNPAAYEDADIAAAIRFIQENACEAITVEDVCEHVSISRRQLERRFLKVVGELPGAQIRHLRINCAKELLTETRLSLTEIALRSGYEHLSSFSAAFRAAVGQTPSSFRRAR